MNLQEFRDLLHQHPEHQVVIELETGMQIAPHFHVTEIGKVTKDFVDCGGTRRLSVACVLQIWVANDVDHRLKTDRLAGIIEKAGVLGLDDQSPMEAEFQTDTIGVYAFTSVIAEDGKLVFKIGAKHTACLALHQGGIESSPIAGQTNCC